MKHHFSLLSFVCKYLRVNTRKTRMKGYIFGVLFLLCLAVILPENSDAYSAGTGRFGDESKVCYSGTFPFF